MIYFRKCANSSFNFQQYLFARKFSTHFNRKLCSRWASVSTSFSSLGDPSKMFRVSAIAADIFCMSSTAAITARIMCLKDLITISWMHIDWMCGSFSASSTTRPREHILSPLVCMKSVMVLPSTGDSSREAKSATSFGSAVSS
uniref:Uncharacterized protein n=1 Tax=Arundo donax TaxID=35708 RepID=A0A0A9CIU9_ARUDO